jgi:hypothetical protein
MKDKKRGYEVVMTAISALAVLNVLFVPPPVSTWIALVALVVIAVLFVLRVRLGGKWFE